MILNEQDDVRLLKSADEIWAGVQEILRKKMKVPAFHAKLKLSERLPIATLANPINPCER